jgi:hypothetical protein
MSNQESSELYSRVTAQHPMPSTHSARARAAPLEVSTVVLHVLVQAIIDVPVLRFGENDDT